MELCHRAAFLAPSIECINIGQMSSPLVVIDTAIDEARHWFGRSPKQHSSWLLHGANPSVSELSAPVPKNYQDYLLEVITPSLSKTYSKALFSGDELLLNSIRCDYSFLSWSPWVNSESAEDDEVEVFTSQKVVPILGKFTPSAQLNVIHYLSAAVVATGFYRHKRTGAELQVDIGGINIGAMNGRDFELLYYCPAKPGRILIYPSNVCQSLILPKGQTVQHSSNILAVRSQLCFSKSVV